MPDQDQIIQSARTLIQQAKQDPSLARDLLHLAHEIIGMHLNLSAQDSSEARKPDPIPASPTIPGFAEPDELDDLMDHFYATMPSQSAPSVVLETHHTDFHLPDSRPEPRIEPKPDIYPLQPDDILAGVINRCTTKGKLIEAIAEADQTLIEQYARELRNLEGRYTWHQELNPRLGQEKLLNMAQNYFVLADVARYLNRTGTTVRHALELAAEAQSAVRSASLELGESGDDSDQRAMFGWLKAYTSQHRVFLSRHMRLNDPANPYNHQDRRRQLNDLLHFHA
ncbi:hypothetical protein [Deinococcus roseus]|uniref:Uncharacterized protein n=1 Tax=Deinococcus roseus TaxID=392414 RepID=A0ABQ2DAU7_9DEIO|nr:hypothetical protein [Deinococcus roseus]GGJ51695.1 hypothetical protein GCM10008938_42140 [Deinococcus roseus]